MILIHILNFLFLLNSAFAEEFRFSYDSPKVEYKVGNTIYRVQRVYPHQQELQHLQIDYRCEGEQKAAWTEDFFEFGLCEVFSADFNPRNRQLDVKYHAKDLYSDPLYDDGNRCEKTLKIRSQKLADKCTIKL